MGDLYLGFHDDMGNNLGIPYLREQDVVYETGGRFWSPDMRGNKHPVYRINLENAFEAWWRALPQKDHMSKSISKILWNAAMKVQRALSNA